MTWFKMHENALVQEVDDELVILNLASEEYYALNATARRLVELCCSSASRGEVIHAMAGEFDVEEQLIAADLNDLINALQQRGLIRVE